MVSNAQEQQPTGVLLQADSNHKGSEQAPREVTGLVGIDTNHRLFQATDCSYVHHPGWLKDWCKKCAFTHTIPRAYAACNSFGTCSGRLETREGTRYFSLINAYLPNTFGTLGIVEKRTF